MSRRWIAYVVLAVCSVVALGAQTTKPTFEVASIRQNVSGTGGSTRLSPGRYSATDTKLHSLIVTAYGISLPQFSLIVGGKPFGYSRLPDRCDRDCSGPDQILKAHFDINATIPQGVPATQESLRQLLRALLEERFNLRARLETRQIPLYALRVARPGQLGPKLRPSSVDSRAECAAWSAARVAARQEAEKTGAPRVSPAEPRSALGRPLCTGTTFNFGEPDGLGKRGAGPMSDLVSQIQQMDRPIVDQTALTGNFEWELITAVRLEDGRWLPPDAPPLDVALRDQLGLRLVEVQTGPFEVLILDSIQMPSEN
jgi:uncharacterized protein (TIGR03435 family)